MCLAGSPDPFITCCFVTDEIVFINLFHTYNRKHYHFFFNIDKREIDGDVAEYDVKNYSSNFPLKCIYNEDKQEIYSFYRLGEAFIIPQGNAKDYQMDQMTDDVLGTMYLIYNKAIVAGTSDCTSFYKLEFDEIEERRVWKCYKTVNVAGSAYYTKGNIRIQIVQ